MKNIPILRQVYYFFTSQDIPVLIKAVAAGLYTLYVLLPLDFIPDTLGVVLGIGYIDDILLAGLFFAAVSKLWIYWKNKNQPGKNTPKITK